MTCTTCDQIKANRIRLVTSTGILTCPSCGAKHDRSQFIDPAITNTSINRKGKILTIEEEKIIQRMFPNSFSSK